MSQETPNTQSEQTLKDLLTQAASTIFVEEFYQGKTEDEMIALVLPEALGILVSRLLGWNGEAIGQFLIRATYAGLEDANWHTECGLFYEWANKLREGIELRDLLPLNDHK